MYRYQMRPLCLYCKHFDFESDASNRRCAAFPDKIPQQIWGLAYDHREPHPDDNGLQFEELDSLQPLFESKYLIRTILPDRLPPFEKEERFRLHAETMRALELGRRYGTALPRIDEHDKKYEPRNAEEERQIKGEKKNRARDEYEAQYDPLTYEDILIVGEKVELKVEREYWSGDEELEYFTRTMDFHAKWQNLKNEVTQLSIIIDVYREIGEEQRLHDIYRQLGKLDRLKLGYDKLEITMPNFEGDKDND